MTTVEAQRSDVVRANGIDIHYVEAGDGPPLLLIDNAMVSTNPIWIGHPFAYATQLAAFAKHFRVILPDTRGSGRTVHPGGPISHALLADDIVAFITALGLNHPMVCGFSDGGEVATILGIRSPGAAQAIVNHGGYDLFNPDPQAPAIAMTRHMLGGRPDATQADFDALARLANDSDDLRVMLRAHAGGSRQCARSRPLANGHHPDSRPDQSAAWLHRRRPALDDDTNPHPRRRPRRVLLRRGRRRPVPGPAQRRAGDSRRYRPSDLGHRR